ncbi:MAG TPA: S8 family serine peptidase, partial [Gemmatimonadaceae bacterium]
MVAKDAESIEDKAVLQALEAVVATYPDVRVFNLSFCEKRALAAYHAVEQRERLINVRDLDNFAFARDVVVVVSAGNSEPGIVPTNAYPTHLDEEPWQLAAWPSGFNTLTCGATVELLHTEGLVKTLGGPSPFTRVGPGIGGAPIPEFGAHGGNVDEDWRWRPSFGVWGCNALGDWEDRAGSSFAAPLLARQAALTLRQLDRFCPPGVRPFAVTAKAFLVLTATRPVFPPAVDALADRTIGYGTAAPTRLAAPVASSALFVWQGVIESAKDVVRIQLPIPIDWLSQAARPELRLVCCWDPPVNEAAREVWATRSVAVRLRTAPGEKALQGSRGVHKTYPMIDRTYDLSKEKLAKLDPAPSQSLWDLEISYDQIAEYHPAITFAPQQRVSFAAELRDAGARPVSPQAAVQALPAAASMTRLGLPPTPLGVPIILRR